jgi:hypothetical protein
MINVQVIEKKDCMNELEYMKEFFLNVTKISSIMVNL